jgi:hypothetical protein
MRTAVRAASTTAVMIACACGGSQRPTDDSDDATFACDDRMAGYIARGTIAAAEIGVAMDCDERGPRLIRWRVEADGTHAEDSHGITPDQFDTLWRKIDQTGWRDLHDCAASGDDAPIYSFSFRDHGASNTFACQHTDPPFPFRTIRDELDIAAARGRRQLGPDEPAPDETKQRPTRKP